MSKKNGAPAPSAVQDAPSAQSAPHDWVSDAQVSSEEMPGFAAAEIEADYRLQMEFAALQVRARAHMKSAWRAYEVAGARSEAVDTLAELLQREPDTLTARVVRVVGEAQAVERHARSEAFGVWADLSKLANADGYNADGYAELSADDTRKGVAALHRLENERAEELLQGQGARRERVRQREAAELAEVRGDATN